MPAETLAEPPVAVTPERAEKKEFTAAEFCIAFAGIYHAQRETVAELMNVSPHRIDPHYVGTHYAHPEHSMTIISKIKEVMDSGLCHDRLERYAEQQPAQLRLHHYELLDFLMRFSAICFAGAASDYLLAKGTYFQKLDNKGLAKEYIVKAHEQFALLADGKFGKAIGLDRRYLRTMAEVMYGQEGRPSNMPDWFETGVSAEVATKRGLEKIIAEREDTATVRYSTSEEDLKGADIVVSRGGKRLLIDVKSSGRIFLEGHYVQSAAHSELEKIDRDSFYIKRLHPASTESIGIDFTVDAGYEKELEEVLNEFDELSQERKRPRHHSGATRHAWGRHRMHFAEPALRGSG